MPCKGQTQREFILAGPGQRRTSLREVLENSFFFWVPKPFWGLIPMWPDPFLMFPWHPWWGWGWGRQENMRKGQAT